MKLLSLGSHKEAKKVKNEKSCNAAFSALKTIRKVERQAKQEEQEKTHQALLDSAEKAFTEEYGNLNWQDYQKSYQNDSCRNHLSFGKATTPKDARCVVMEKHYNNLIEKAKNTFAQNPFHGLVREGEEQCKLNKGRHSPCGVWKSSLSVAVSNQFANLEYPELFAKQREYCKIKSEFRYEICNAFDQALQESLSLELKKYSNDGIFKSAFDKCHGKSKSIKAEGFKSSGQVLVEQDGFCSAVNQATRQRSLLQNYYFAKPL